MNDTRCPVRKATLFFSTSLAVDFLPTAATIQKAPPHMEPMTLESLRSEVRRLARRIGAPAGTLPTFGRTQDGARPHIEVDARGYHWVVVERGIEYERVTSRNADEILYITFQSMTFEMACQYELAHREPEEDFRRILFRHQLELLTALSPRWAERRRMQQEAILERNPFVDRRVD